MPQQPIPNVEEIQTVMAYLARDMDRLAQVARSDSGLAREAEKVQRSLEDFAVWLFHTHPYLIPGKIKKPFRQREELPTTTPANPVVAKVRETLEQERRDRVHPWKTARIGGPRATPYVK